MNGCASGLFGFHFPFPFLWSFPSSVNMLADITNRGIQYWSALDCHLLEAMTSASVILLAITNNNNNSQPWYLTITLWWVQQSTCINSTWPPWGRRQWCLVLRSMVLGLGRPETKSRLDSGLAVGSRESRLTSSPPFRVWGIRYLPAA